MSIRVHELAKRCGLSNKDMIEKLHTMNYPVKSHSSTVDKITAESIEKEYGYIAAPPPPPAPEAPVPASPAATPAAVAAEKNDGAAVVAIISASAPVAEPPNAATETPQLAPVKI